MIYVWDKFAHIHLCFASVCIFGDSPDADVSHQSTKLFFSLCKELWTSRYLIQRDDQPRADDPESVLLSPKPIRTTLEMQLDPRVSRGSVLVFLRKPIATCDFPVGGGGGVRTSCATLGPPMPVLRKRVLVSCLLYQASR